MLVLLPSLHIVHPYICEISYFFPNVPQNLIFVSQFCQTNKVSIDCFLWHFKVKDLHMREILLCRLNEHNVYKVTPPLLQPQTSFTQTLPTLPLWHQCCGHSSSTRILHALKTNNNFFISLSNKSLDCLSNEIYKIQFYKSSINSSYHLEIV